jgi:hypothetical protein
VARYALALSASMVCLACLCCGRIDTAVGVELTPDAGIETSTSFDGGSEADVVPCTGDLSNIGTADFHLSLTVATTQVGLVALVNQRATCAPSVFWDIRMQDGLVFVEVDDVTHYTALSDAGASINDGVSHAVRVERAAGVVTAYVDGVETGVSPSRESLGALPLLASGTDVCVTSSDGTAAFIGKITNVCVGSP